MQMNRKSNFLCGVRNGIPIGLGYFAVSFSFGIAAVTARIEIFQAVLISLTNVTSAGQFAGIGVIAAGGSMLEMVLTQLVINLRYSLMSIATSQRLDKKESRLHRLGIGFGMTDEIFAVSAAQPAPVSAWFHYGAMSVAIPGWVLGTFLGALLGSVLPDMIVSALSVALYGMFIAIVVTPAKKERRIALAVLGTVALSCAFAYLPVLKKVSAGFAIVIVTVTVSALAAWLSPVGEEAAHE